VLYYEKSIYEPTQTGLYYASTWQRILPVVLYGYEPWSLTLREEHRLKMFENRVLRRIFGPMRYELIGGWRKLNHEELHNLYCSPSIIAHINLRSMIWAGHVARMGEEECI
jgi:hypothetical protein